MPTGSVRSRRLCADAGCWSGRQAAVDAVPSPDHTQRAFSAPLLRHQHHDAQNQNRNLSRTRARRTSGASRATSVAEARAERTGSRTDGNDERGELHCAADLCFSLQQRVPHGHPQDTHPLPESLFTPEQCQRPARRPTAGITPTMWDRTAWRRRWAKDRQVSESPPDPPGMRVMLSGLSSASPRLPR